MGGTRLAGRITLACAIGCAWIVGGSPAAHAAVTCAQDEFEQPVVNLSAHMDAVRVFRGEAGEIMVDPAPVGLGADPGAPAQCGTATVANTSTLTVRGASEAAQVVDIDLRPGLLQPGFGDEPGSSDEIEIVLDLGGGRNATADVLRVTGQLGDDGMTVGRDGINLNSREVDGVDVDVTYRGTAPRALEILARTGRDGVAMNGGRGTGGQPGVAWLYVDGGLGNDRLTGSKRTDIVAASCGRRGDALALIAFRSRYECLRGGAGNDILYGLAGTDWLNGDAGDDVIHAGNGRDYLHGDSGDDRLYGGSAADRLDGGSQTDVCRGGWGNDSFRNCEQR